VRIGDDDARVFPCGQSFADNVIEMGTLRAPDFDHAVDGPAKGDLAKSSGNVVGCDWLEKHVGKPHRIALCGKIGNAFDEFEELCGAHN
jgi:hypothetical protein